MTQRAKERSAFCTRRGLYQFTRMPFGLSNAPASFCRLMQIILNDLLYVCCICYLDDIIVFGETPEQLMENLDRVFTRLKEKGLKAKPSKCVLFRSPIDFLGHMVSADGIQPQPDKLAAIRDWPTPHCLRDVRAFYGLASYYRKFVRDFAKIAEPLSRMTKKNTPFTWTDETQQSFEDLKRALLDVDTLAYPTPGTPCILDTDASDVAVGAVLSQMVDGVEKPIAYFSRVLNSTQRNYCPTRRELLAVIHLSNTSDTTSWATKSSSEQTITVSNGSGLSNDLKGSWQDGSKHWQNSTSRLNIAQDVYTPMPMRFLDKTASSVGERSPLTTGLMNVKEQINSSSHCLFTRFSCAPSSQTMPLPSYKQKIPRSEKPMR